MMKILLLIIFMFPFKLTTQHVNLASGIKISVSVSKQIDCGEISFPLIYPDSTATRVH